MSVKTAVGSAEEPERRPDAPSFFGFTGCTSTASVPGGFRTTAAALRAFTAVNVTFRPAIGRRDP